MSVQRSLDDEHYFHARAVEEKVAARRATWAAARERHEEMAAVYRFKAALLKTSKAAEEHAADPLDVVTSAADVYAG